MRARRRVDREATCVSAIKDNDIFIIEINCRARHVRRSLAAAVSREGELKFGPSSARLEYV